MEEEKEEEVVKWCVSKIELDELKRLHTIADQAPNRVIGTINLQEESRRNLLDYHGELAKKYKFNPFTVGVNRHTGELQLLPKEVLDEVTKEKKDKEKALRHLIEQFKKAQSAAGKKKDE